MSNGNFSAEFCCASEGAQIRRKSDHVEVETVARAWAFGNGAQADVLVFSIIGSEACVDVVEEIVPTATELLCFALYARHCGRGTGL